MCPDAKTLSAYFDRETTEDASARIEAHLADCPACRATMDLFAAQRRVLRSVKPEPAGESRSLDEFWRYVGRSRIQKVAGPRRLSVPLPLAAAAALALVAATVMNFIPGRRPDVPNVLVVEAPVQAPTVVSLTVTPGELDAFFAALENTAAIEEHDGIPTLPAELPVARFGEPMIVRPAGFEGER